MRAASVRTRASAKRALFFQSGNAANASLDYDAGK
jgi:hypothetical protein